MLLPVLSRMVAKLVATRLQTWAESQGLLRQLQWGFRPNRRRADPTLILTLLLEMANDPEWDSLVIVLWDIIKLKHILPRNVIRAGHEYSDPFDLAIGFREGCPSSPVCFSIFRNFAIGRFLKRQKAAKNAGIHCTVNPTAPFHPRRKLAGNARICWIL